jgi:hypothetical protein
VVFDSCQPHVSDTNLFAYNDQKLGGSTTTSPLMIYGTASVRWVFTFGLPAAAQEQDGHLKPKKLKTN